jgi:hypothetical protein
MEILGEAAPDLPRVGLGPTAVDPRHAEFLERHALAVEHPEDVVIGDDEQRRRIRKRLVLREPRRIGVSVRTDDRQVLDRAIELARDRAGLGIGRKQAIGMRRQGRFGSHDYQNPWDAPPSIGSKTPVTNFAAGEQR